MILQEDNMMVTIADLESIVYENLCLSRGGSVLLSCSLNMETDITIKFLYS